MELIVLLLFVVPPLIGVAIAAVKTFELAVNRDIASARKVAIATLWTVAVVVAVSGLALFIFLEIATASDPASRPPAQREVR